MKMWKLTCKQVFKNEKSFPIQKTDLNVSKYRQFTQGTGYKDEGRKKEWERERERERKIEREWYLWGKREESRFDISIFL